MKNKFKIPVLLLALTVLSLTSCFTSKQLTYFQGNIPVSDTVNSEFPLFKPTAGDVLYIQVNHLGFVSKKVDNPYPPITADLQSPPPADAVGYPIDKNGFIYLPIAGALFTTGKSTLQLQDTIQARLKPFLISPTVSVRLATLRLTVLGEVNKPSTYIFNYYAMTLPQALGLAGDLTAYARRDDLLVIRRAGNKQIFGHVDLTKSSVFNSPYYWVYPGDVIYVSPNKARADSLDRNYRLFPIILSGISVIGTIILALK